MPSRSIYFECNQFQSEKKLVEQNGIVYKSVPFGRKCGFFVQLSACIECSAKIEMKGTKKYEWTFLTKKKRIERVLRMPERRRECTTNS